MRGPGNIEDHQQLFLLIEGYRGFNPHLLMLDDSGLYDPDDRVMCFQPHVAKWITDELDPDTKFWGGGQCVKMEFVTETDFTLFKTFWL